MQNTKQAVFMLGEEEYGMDIMEVNIIEKFMAIEPVANSHKNLKGLIRLRGDVIPVYSLRRKFGMPDVEPDDETRFIITTSSEIMIAYEIDRMSEIVEFEEKQMFEVPEIIKSKDTSYLRLITNVGDRLIKVLDQNAVLSDEEQYLIKELVNKATTVVK